MSSGTARLVAMLAGGILAMGIAGCSKDPADTFFHANAVIIGGLALFESLVRLELAIRKETKA